MGANHSQQRHDRQQRENTAVGIDDKTPVMGDGFCPIYDAALVGDWTRLIKLCKTSVIIEDRTVAAPLQKRNKDQNDGDAEDENDKLEISVLSSSRREWIAGLDYFDGGHDYDGINLDISYTDTQTQLPISPSDVQLSLEQQQQQQTAVIDSTGGEGHANANDEDIDHESDSKSAVPLFFRTPRKLFVDAKGNTPLHLACRRDPPLSAIRALLTLHSPSAWMQTHDGWIPLHLSCHCGCDVEVANELLNAMEETCDDKKYNNSQQISENDEDEDEGDNIEDIDPLLPRDIKGRTPLHLACASSRDALRRPDLVRLLLLRSKDPRKAALTRDNIDGGQRLGLDLALGELKVILGTLLNDENEVNNTSDEKEGGENDHASHASANGGGSQSLMNGERHSFTNGSVGTIDTSTKSQDKERIDSSTKSQQRSDTLVGRTPLNLVEDDYREELEDLDIKTAILLVRGEDVDDAEISDNYDTFYECWALMSILMLAAGTDGTPERVKEVLGGGAITTNGNGQNREKSSSTYFSKPIQDIIQDFQSIHKACNSIDDSLCPHKFKELTKKFLQGEVDKSKLGKVSDLTSKWESRSRSGSFRDLKTAASNSS